jgi:hypothetical protein
MAASIESLFNDIQTNIQDIKDEADTSIERLQSFASLPFQTWVSFTPNPIYEPPVYTPSKSFEDVGELNLPEFDESSLSLDNPDRFKSKIWNDPELDYIIDQLRIYLTSGGLGHTEEYIRAFSEYQKERDRQALEDGILELKSIDARKGFPLPTTMLTTQMAELATRHQYVIADRNREILQRFSEIVDRNIQFAIEKNIDISKLYADFSIRFSTVFKDISDLIIEKYKTIVNARVAEFEATIRGIASEIELIKANAELELGYNQLTIEKWKTETTLAVEKTKALISQSENATQIRLSAARELASTLVGLIASSQQHSVGLITTEEQL